MSLIEIDHADQALTDLVATATIRAYKAETTSLPDTAYVLRDIASTLTNARTRLALDGPDYLDAAWAFVEGARTVLGSIGPDGVTRNLARTYREANHG